MTTNLFFAIGLTFFYALFSFVKAKSKFWYVDMKSERCKDAKKLYLDEIKLNNIMTVILFIMSFGASFLIF